MISLLGLVSVPAPVLAPPKESSDRFTEIWRLGMWVALYSIVAFAVTQVVLDWDIWWHMRVGQWVVEHRTVTTTDPFSDYGQDRPWVAYSWLFEVVVYGLHWAFGMYGIVLFRIVLSFALVAAVHRFVVKRLPHGLMALGLVTAATIALAPLLNVRPWLFTILFSLVTLDALLDLRAGRAARTVWLLPLVYVLWANIHIQFVYGLLLLGLGCAAPVIDYFLRRDEEASHASKVGTRGWWSLVGLTLACFLATFVNPYGPQLYRVVFEYGSQTGAFQIVSELTALEFRTICDWTVLALVVLAACALGRRKRVSAFEVLLLIATAYFAFRAKRDVWFATLGALAVLTTPARTADPASIFPWTWRRLAALAAVLVLVTAVSALGRGLSRSGLERWTAEKFPVTAAQHVAEHGYEGPMFNDFNSGGYLIWALPQHRVSLDGRTNLHGDERLFRNHRTWSGVKGWEDDPELNAANLVIGDPHLALAELLKRDARFEKVFEDDNGIVFVRRGTAW
jgi:hypothetical protein